MAKTLRDLMPANAKKKLGNVKLNVLSSHDVFRVLKDEKVIIMACNTRIKHVIPGIMRAAEDLDAVVCFELAKSESNLKGGYTGMTPAQYADVVFGYAEAMKFSRPFFIHGDHVTTKSPDPAVVGDGFGEGLVSGRIAARIAEHDVKHDGACARRGQPVEQPRGVLLPQYFSFGREKNDPGPG